MDTSAWSFNVYADVQKDNFICNFQYHAKRKIKQGSAASAKTTGTGIDLKFFYSQCRKLI